MKRVHRLERTAAIAIGVAVGLGGICCSGGGGASMRLDAAPETSASGGAPGPAGTGGAGTGGMAFADGATDSIGAGSGGAAPPAGEQVTVSAGAVARDHSIVTFPLLGRAGKVLALRDAQGGTLPLQVDADGVATFILPSLAAGQEARFTVVDPSPAPAVAITVAPESNGVRIKNGDRDLLRFQTVGTLPAGAAAMYLRGGYVYPFYTPAGGVPSDDYPPSHPHQHGIWSAWLSATFAGHTINFWDFTGGARGKVDFEAMDVTWQGPVHGGLRARLAHIDLSGAQPVTALHEQWMITAYHTHDGVPPYFVFDLSSTQEAAGAQPFVVNQATYSGFGVRGARPWVGGGGVIYLNSQGQGRADGDGAASRWAYLGGLVDGKMVGSAMLGDPKNFRAPQKVRFNPTEPYWAFAPMRDGPFTITTGQPLKSRFRVVTIDGPPDRALIDRLWTDFATPPTVAAQ